MIPMILTQKGITINKNLLLSNINNDKYQELLDLLTVTKIKKMGQKTNSRIEKLYKFIIHGTSTYIIISRYSYIDVKRFLSDIDIKCKLINKIHDGENIIKKLQSFGAISCNF